MTNIFPCLPTTTPHTHTHTCTPLHLPDTVTAHQLKTMWLRGMMTDSVRSWQAQTPLPPWTSCPSTHTCFLFATGGNDERRKRPGPETVPEEILLWSWAQSCLLPSSRQRSTSQRYVANHALTTRYTTQRTTAVYDHIEREGPRGTYWDIGYLCWPEKQKCGFKDYSGGKDNKATETLLDKWMTAERVAGQQQGKPCGLLNCIPLRLWQCDDARDDEDNK